MAALRSAVSRKFSLMWHPVTPLLCWAGFAVALQWIVSSAWLAGIAVTSLALSLVFAGERGRMLLWRARWLLASLVFLFLFFTPGEYLPGGLGATREGLVRAVDAVGRLVTLLASLALLHERIGTAGLLSGLHALLRPFAFRDASVVRMLLVLEYVERRHDTHWREWLGDPVKQADAMTKVEVLKLAVSPVRFRDYAVLCGWALILGLWGVWA